VQFVALRIEMHRSAIRAIPISFPGDIPTIPTQHRVGALRDD